jgi:hypothetical protein
VRWAPSAPSAPSAPPGGASAAPEGEGGPVGASPSERTCTPPPHQAASDAGRTPGARAAEGAG